MAYSIAISHLKQDVLYTFRNSRLPERFSGSLFILTQASKNITGCKIDRNLTITQGIMGYMSKIDTADSAEIQDKVEKAKWFAGVGSAGPGVVAGVMLIMYRIAMSLFIGFGPLFILCLLFKKTSPLFSKWLYYGLATIFSSVMLAVMADIAMDLTSTVAGTLFTSNKLYLYSRFLYRSLFHSYHEKTTQSFMVSKMQLNRTPTPFIILKEHISQREHLLKFHGGFSGWESVN